MRRRFRPAWALALGLAVLLLVRPLEGQAQDGASLTASPSTVAPAGQVTASWRGIPSPSSSDWIALYASSGAAHTAYLDWRYTTGAAEGNVAFTLPTSAAAGTIYELRLFANNGFMRLATSNPFAVSSAATATLRVGPTSVAREGSVTATWSGIARPTRADWLGLYASAGAADGSYLGWRYTTGTDAGSVTFPLPANATAGTT